MKPFLRSFGIVAGIVLTVLALVYFALFYQHIPSDVIAALESGTEFRLLSLDPDASEFGTKPQRIPDDPQFLGYRLLGEKTIVMERERNEIIFEIRWIILKGFGQNLCFAPRHAVSVKHEGKKFEILICYECKILSVMVDGKDSKTFSIDGMPDRFNAILKAANVRLAK